MSVNWERRYYDRIHAVPQDDRRITAAMVTLCAAGAILFVALFVWLGNYIATAIDKMGAMPR